MNYLIFLLKHKPYSNKFRFVTHIFLSLLFFINISPAEVSNCHSSLPTTIYGTLETPDKLLLRTVKWPASGKMRGTVILVQGMGGFIEAYDGFAQWLSQVGFDVLSFDLRGQGDSGRVTTKKTLLHIHSFDEYIQDLDHFIKAQHKLPSPLIFIGTSMGGNIALRYIHENPKACDALILLSPMIDINTRPYPYPIARGIASVALALGAEENFVIGYDSFSLESCINRYDPKKHGCPNKYYQDCHMLHEKPSMAIGGPSYNWLASAFQSCDIVNNEEFARSISLPVLMVSVTDDHLVDTQAQLDFCKTVPFCKQILYENAHHNVLKDKEEVFKQLSKDISTFLHSSLNL